MHCCVGCVLYKERGGWAASAWRKDAFSKLHKCTLWARGHLGRCPTPAESVKSSFSPKQVGFLGLESEKWDGAGSETGRETNTHTHRGGCRKPGGAPRVWRHKPVMILQLRFCSLRALTWVSWHVPGSLLLVTLSAWAGSSCNQWCLTEAKACEKLLLRWLWVESSESYAQSE